MSRRRGGPKGPSKEELAARKQAMRERLEAKKAEGRRRLEAKKAALERKRAGARAGDPKRKRRRALLVVLLVALLLLLLRTCSCAEPPEEVAEPVEAPAAGPGEPVEPATPLPPTPGGRVEPVQRPAYVADTPEPVPWLTQFRMQVSSRAPRLAACFVGASEPGALRWTAKVEPSTGLVGDQLVEPTSAGAELSKAQRTCVYEVLGDPPYVLEGATRSTPVPVGLVVEF